MTEDSDESGRICHLTSGQNTSFSFAGGHLSIGWLAVWNLWSHDTTLHSSATRSLTSSASHSRIRNLERLMHVDVEAGSSAFNGRHRWNPPIVALRHNCGDIALGTSPADSPMAPHRSQQTSE
jgi:hypothetical protein